MDEICPGCGRKLQRGLREGEKESPDRCYRYARKKSAAQADESSDYGPAVVEPLEPKKLPPLPLLSGDDE